MSRLKEHIDYIRSRIINDIETTEGGYKVWWPLHGHGFLNATDLRIIADYLDELNKDWDNQIQQFFKSQHD